MKEIITLLIFIVIFIACSLAMTSCTYSINLVHTQGTASDVVDETQSAEPDIKTEISIPGA